MDRICERILAVWHAAADNRQPTIRADELRTFFRCVTDRISLNRGNAWLSEGECRTSAVDIGSSRHFSMPYGQIFDELRTIVRSTFPKPTGQSNGFVSCSKSFPGKCSPGDQSRQLRRTQTASASFLQNDLPDFTDGLQHILWLDIRLVKHDADVRLLRAEGPRLPVRWLPL